MTSTQLRLLKLKWLLQQVPSPDRISFGNTIKKERDIAKAMPMACHSLPSIPMKKLKKLPVLPPVPKCSAAF